MSIWTVITLHPFFVYRTCRLSVWGSCLRREFLSSIRGTFLMFMWCLVADSASSIVKLMPFLAALLLVQNNCPDLLCLFWCPCFGSASCSRLGIAMCRFGYRHVFPITGLSINVAMRNAQHAWSAVVWRRVDVRCPRRLLLEPGTRTASFTNSGVSTLHCSNSTSSLVRFIAWAKLWL